MNEHTHHYDASTPDEAEASDAETRDPVCGMKVKAGSPHGFTHDGEHYPFCSARCLENFRAEPAKFTGKAKVEPSASTPPIAPGGARLELRPSDASQLDALREHVRWHQQRMHSGECWMLQGQPTATPRGEQE